MKQWFADLFSESSDVSMTRFLCFVCAGLGAKVWQRSIESKELPDEKV
jgi:hypothetical protein